MAKDPHFVEILSRHGRAVQIARALGITRQAVYQWDRVPAEKAAAVAEATGLTLTDLRPDLWPSEGV